MSINDRLLLLHFTSHSIASSLMFSICKRSTCAYIHGCTYAYVCLCVCVSVRMCDTPIGSSGSPGLQRAFLIPPLKDAKQTVFVCVHVK